MYLINLTFLMARLYRENEFENSKRLIVMQQAEESPVPSLISNELSLGDV